MKSVQQVSNRKKQSLYLLFVDLTAAFDHISRKCLFDSIKLRFPEGENGKLFNILGKAHPCSICMLSSLCVFSWINIRKMTLFEFLNISTNSLRNQYPDSKDWECYAVGIFYCTLVLLCERSYFIHLWHSFTAESDNHSWWNIS